MVTNVDEALSRVLETVDEVSDPDNMTRAEYGEFLEELISDLQIRNEARKEEDGE